MGLECLRNKQKVHVAGAERIMGRRSGGGGEGGSQVIRRLVSTVRSWDLILIAGGHWKNFSGRVTALDLFF